MLNGEAASWEGRSSTGKRFDTLEIQRIERPCFFALFFLYWRLFSSSDTLREVCARDLFRRPFRKTDLVLNLSRASKARLPNEALAIRPTD
jgi:hypothetical protein